MNNINSVLPRSFGHRITYIILRGRNLIRLLLWKGKKMLPKFLERMKSIRCMLGLAISDWCF